jgi:uncharacterized protein (TIGR01244 family)
MKKYFVRVFVVAGFGFAIALGFLGRRYFLGLPQNFGEVVPDRLYRSGQGSSYQLRQAIERYHLKTVICLRKIQEDKEPRWFRQEKEILRRTGVRFIHCPLTAETLRDDATWIKLLQIAQDPARQPVLVHCARGELRTGFFCAIYRMVIENYPRAKAIAEMKKFGYDAEQHKTAISVLERFDIHGARVKLIKSLSLPSTQP